MILDYKKNFKDNYEDFKPIIGKLQLKYDFKGLWHFTDFSNLQSIFNDGKLSSRNRCIKDNKKFQDGANHDVLDKASDFVHDCTRFYYRPQTPTLFDNEGIKPLEYQDEIHIPRPVYLLFKYKLIFLKDTFYSNGNATCSKIDNTEEFFEQMDWENIFHNTWFVPEDRDKIINKRQAELLSNKPVSLQYLKKIIFRSNADLKQAITIWGENDKFIVDNSYFSNKNNLYINDWRYNNYIDDYKINCQTDRVKVVLKFKKLIQNYKVSFSVIDKNGKNKVSIVKNSLKVSFYDCFGNITNNKKSAIKIKLIFSNLSDKDIIRIYLNKCLCIEEMVVF